MSSNSGIEWTDHTFNPWWGCTKVHDGCTNCYAEALDKRWGGEHWGNSPRRMVLGEWGKPARWNAEAVASGLRRRVFCASMCDLFEDHAGDVVDQRGNPAMKSPPRPSGGGEHQGERWTVPMLRARVFEMVNETTMLDWLLLTKRPENITRMVPASWLRDWPGNVLTGTSPCNQKTADKCIPDLLNVPGRHFLSCEPLLGHVNLTKINLRDKGTYDKWRNALDNTFWQAPGCLDDGTPTEKSMLLQAGRGIDWVIVGCESRGKRAGRFADGYVDAAKRINDQCREAGVPVFNKQVPVDGRVSHDPCEWPEGIRSREFYAAMSGATP